MRFFVGGEKGAVEAVPAVKSVEVVVKRKAEEQTSSIEC